MYLNLWKSLKPYSTQRISKINHLIILGENHIIPGWISTINISFYYYIINYVIEEMIDKPLTVFNDPTDC